MYYVNKKDVKQLEEALNLLSELFEEDSTQKKSESFFNFSEALIHMDKDLNVSRRSWGNPDIFILKIVGDCIRNNLKDHYGDPTKDIRDFYKVEDFFVKVNKPKNTIEVYFPSQEDLLAADFFIVQ